MTDEIADVFRKAYDLRVQIFALVHRPDMSSVEDSLRSADVVAKWVASGELKEAANG